MASELQICPIPYATGKTVYFQVRTATGTIWRVDTLVFEAYATANIGHYNIPGTEQGTASGYYTGSMSSSMAAGFYNVVAFQQAGGSPAEGDTPLGSQPEFYWTGSAVSKALSLVDANNFVKVDVEDWTANAVAATSVNGVPKVDVADWLGTAVTAATAGIPDVNTKNYNNVAATTDANNLPKVDVEDWKAGVVPAVNVTGVPKVDVVDWLGAAPNALISGRVDSVCQLRSSTTQAGSTAGTIKLDAGASATDSFYNDCIVWDITTNQSRLITAYVGATKVATVSPSWQTTPGTGDAFVIIPSGYVDLGTILGTASQGAAGYVGIDWAKVTNPTTTLDLSGTTIKNLDNNPPGTLTAAQIATGVWQDATAGDFTVAASIGKSLYTSGAVPGAANGLMIAGSNAATTLASLTVTGTLTANALTIASTVSFQGAFTVSGTTTLAGVNAGAVTMTSLSIAGSFFIGGSSIPTLVWQDATASDFTVASSIGKSLYTGNHAPGTASGLPINNSAGNVPADIQTISTQTVTCAGAVTVGAFVGNANAAIGVTVAGKISEVVLTDTLTTYTGNTPQTGDAFARLGAPAGATIAADIAEVEGETDSIIATLAAGVTVGGYTSGQDPGTLIFDASSTVEGYTFRQWSRLIGAVICGLASGGPGATVFKAMGGTAARVTSIDDASGNRTTVTLSP